MGIESPLKLTPPTFSKGILFGDVEQPTQDIVTASATQNYALGTKLTYSDGRVFRYARNGGTALAKALMTCSEAQDAKLIAETQSSSGGSVSVGDYEIVVDITTGISLSANELQGGTLIVATAPAGAIGDQYTILASEVDASDDTLLTLRLLEPIRTAWTTSTVISIVKNRWNEVDVAATTAVGVPAGVPLIAVTANYYCWVQTKGYCAMLVDASDTIVKGEPAGKPGTNGTAGAVGLVANDGTDVVYGTCVYEASAGAPAIIDLKID